MKQNKIINGAVIVLIMLIVVGCGGEENKKNCPSGDFTVNNASPKVNDSVTFKFENAEVKSWEWNFGDSTAVGTSSIESHVYSKPGKYTITLRINGPEGCDKIADIEVKAGEAVAAEVGKGLPKIEAPATANVGDAVAFKETSGAAKSWEWFFSETGLVDSKEQNPTYTFKEAGTKKVTLIINGNSPVTAFEIKVSPNPNVSNYSSGASYSGSSYSGSSSSGSNNSGSNNNALTSNGSGSQKSSAASEDKFRTMFQKVADREITSDAFGKYINGYFAMPIKVNGKEVEFDSYLKRLGITGEFNAKSISIKKDKNGFVNDIEITE